MYYPVLLDVIDFAKESFLKEKRVPSVGSSLVICCKKSLLSSNLSLNSIVKNSYQRIEFAKL